MEGTWGFRSLEVDGSTMPDSMLTNSRLLIDGDRFRMESPEADYEGIFVIDVEQAPHHIDIEFVEGPESRKSFPRHLSTRRGSLHDLLRFGRGSASGTLWD
jgi:uncharacterized protein (TIGR03067 family)